MIAKRSLTDHRVGPNNKKPDKTEQLLITQIRLWKTEQRLYAAKNQIKELEEKLASCSDYKTTSKFAIVSCFTENDILTTLDKPLTTSIILNFAPSLTVIRFEHINIPNQEIFAKSLADSNLKELYLYSCNITYSTISTIAKLLNQSKLIILHLGDNNIESRGAVALGKALKENSTLQSLLLFNNSIGTGVKALGKALMNNSSLTTLNLASNKINNIESIGICLKHNVSLTELDLSYNKIKSVDDLAKSLHENSSLMALKLSGTVPKKTT